MEKYFLKCLMNLKQRIISKKDLIMADKGYVSYDNYEIGIIDYHIIPFKFPRENMEFSKILSCFDYQLEVFKEMIN